MVGAAPIVSDHFARSIEATRAFFEVESRRVAECCRRMADRFNQRASLIVIGEGAQATDAQHVAVEFIHPVLVGKRALPALSLTSDMGVFSATREPSDSAFAPALRTLARRDDIVLGLCAEHVGPAVRDALVTARAQGLLTILITGCTQDPSVATLADIVFRIDHEHSCVVQEVSETLYHVLWELVHVFFETDAAHLVSFLPPPTGATRPGDLISDVQRSTLAKAGDICALREALCATSGPRIAEAGRAFAARVRQNGRLLAFGNGGSATDAQDAAVDCLAPPVSGWRAIPAMALINDVGVVSAIANDVGFDHVFSRQVIAFGRATDIALGFSTSGASRNVVAAMNEAKARGLLTIAMSGGDGGELARSPAVDLCVTVPSEYVPRIQEAHATAWHALLAVAQEELA